LQYYAQKEAHNIFQREFKLIENLLSELEVRNTDFLSILQNNKQNYIKNDHVMIKADNSEVDLSDLSSASFTLTLETESKNKFNLADYNGLKIVGKFEQKLSQDCFYPSFELEILEVGELQ